MYKRVLVDQLLDGLDLAANSNSFWISLDLPIGDFDLAEVLLRHLESGNFHYELVKEDIERDWNLYTEVIFPKSFDQPLTLQKPGNTWNGNSVLEIEEIDQGKMKAFLVDLLTGTKKFFSRSSSGKQMEEKQALTLIEEIIYMFDKMDTDWSVFNLKPNFLNQADDYFNSGYIQLGYFENHGRDLALCFHLNKQLFILLTNGYA